MPMTGPLFVSGPARSGKSSALAVRLCEVVSGGLLKNTSGDSPGDSSFDPPITGSTEPVLGMVCNPIWISANRSSAAAFRADISTRFPSLVGRVRITTPYGLASSIGYAARNAVARFDAPALPASGLDASGLGASGLSASGFNSDFGVGTGPILGTKSSVFSEMIELLSRIDGQAPLRSLLLSAIGWSARIVADDVDRWSQAETAFIQALLSVSCGLDTQLIGVSVDPSGKGFPRALRLWPELDDAIPLAAPIPSPIRSRVICTHRSLAPDATAQVLAEAHRSGVAWHEMAVVVRSKGISHRNVGPNAARVTSGDSVFVDALVRSGHRAGIPIDEPGHRASADPIVRKWLRSVDGQLATSAPSLAGQPQTPILGDLLFQVWEREIARFALAAGPSSAAACTAVFRSVRTISLHDTGACRIELRRLLQRASVSQLLSNDAFGPALLDPPDPDHLPDDDHEASDSEHEHDPDDEASDPGASDSEYAYDRRQATLSFEVAQVQSRVSVLTPDELTGRQFSVLVAMGLVEGTWPSASQHDFGVASEFTDRRAALALHVASEEAHFSQCVARTTKSIVAIAAPEPGVLISRFIEDWPTHRYAYQIQRRAAPLPVLTETPGVVPCFANGRLRLSASQLSTFENCPQNFAYQYVAAVRSSGSVQASVGTMVHAALERYLRNPHETDITPSEALIPYTPEDCGLPELLACLEETWDSRAFAYRPQEADYRRRAEDWLRTWWENELPKIAEVVAVEHSFSITVGDDDEHVLVGSIDRVSIDPNGNLEVVDYKTGTPPAGTIDDEDLQLATYHLAVTQDPAFGNRNHPDRLRLHFLQNGKDIDQPIRPNHEEQTSARIAFRAHEILSENFRPSIDADCQYCAFQRACPIQPLGAEVGS